MILRNVFCFAMLNLICVDSANNHLYTLLGVSREASNGEIKRAYRNKARDTHPDKQRGVDPEIAAIAFREIVEAYETLSDETSRKYYDMTGQTMSESKQKQTGQQHQQHRHDWNWGFNFNSAGRRGKKQHRYLFDPSRRVHIRDAQTRVIKIRSLYQLKSIIVGDDDDSNKTERYTIIAFRDSSAGCSDTLNDEILFPWPFAGYNYENSGGMWWDEIVLTGTVDSSIDDVSTTKLLEFFGVERRQDICCTIVFIPRGTPLDELQRSEKLINPKTAEEFMSFIWPKLKMNVYFKNLTPYTIHFWWIDGHLGTQQPNIAPGEVFAMKTFISHTFFFRASFVQGNSLTNEVSLVTLLFINTCIMFVFFFLDGRTIELFALVFFQDI